MNCKFENKEMNYHITVNPSDANIALWMDPECRNWIGAGLQFTNRPDIDISTQLVYAAKMWMQDNWMKIEVIQISAEKTDRHHIHIVVKFNSPTRSDNLRSQLAKKMFLENTTSLEICIQQIKTPNDFYRTLAYGQKDLDIYDIYDEHQDKNIIDYIKDINELDGEGGYIVKNEKYIFEDKYQKLDYDFILENYINYKIIISIKNKYKSLTKQKFFEKLMNEYALEQGEVELEEVAQRLYKKGFYLKDLAPKYVFHNMKYIVGEVNNLKGFDLGQYD